MNVKEFPVDLVYLWVNGNDPEWQHHRNQLLDPSALKPSMDCEGRYADNNELKFSLRSVEMYAPWIRKIFIVTDHQVPEWLNTENPKIQIVDHTEILPSAALPTFNSNVIEHALFHIPGLSEHFLYANDDMFINRPVEVDYFFANDGLPIIRLNRRPFRKLALFFKEKILGKPLSNYNLNIRNSARLVEKKFGKYIGHKTHHNIDAYLKSDYQHAFEIFKNDIEPTLKNHFRKPDDIQRNLYSYVPLMERRGHKKFVTQKKSLRLHIDNHRYYKKFEKYNPVLFCTNDSEYAASEDRKLLTKFLRKRFPEKSQFEKT